MYKSENKKSVVCLKTMYKNYLKHSETSKTSGKLCTWAGFIAHHNTDLRE